MLLDQLPTSKLLNYKSTLKDYLLLLIQTNPNIQANSYIKVKTNIPSFQPIYYYKILQRYKDRQTVLEDIRKSKEARNSISKLNHNILIQQPVLQYGSQLYLRERDQRIIQEIKMVERQKYANSQKSYGIKSIQIIKNGLYPDYAFFQILIEDRYLIQKQQKQIILSNQQQSQSIWVLQQVQDQDTYRFFNVNSCCYLFSQNIHGQKYALGLTEYQNNPNTEFIIKTEQFQQNGYFTLTPNYRNKSNKGQPYHHPSSHKLNKNSILLQGQMCIQIIPIQNSVTNLFYELKLAQQKLSCQPSIRFLHQFIRQLIFYTIPQFGQNQGLLSVPIQKLLAQTGLSQKMLNYIIYQLGEGEYKKQLYDLIGQDIRLLCLGSQQNSAIYKKLVTKILDLFDYQNYIGCLVKLIHNNYYFINSFQSMGWSRIFQKKLELTYNVDQIETFNKLLKLAAQFCMGNYSIPNKYFLMHTLQQLYNQDQKSKNHSSEEDEKQNYWIRLFQQGQYVFVEKQDRGQYKQIELQTYLNESRNNQLIYMGQIYMISSLCSGFNINAINRYYHILKAISAYCYNQAYPFFQNSQCKEATLQAIVVSFDWNDNYRKLENKSNIDCVFVNNDIGSLHQNDKVVRERNITKNNKFQLSKLNRNVINRGNQSLTNIFKHFILAFQSHMLNLFKTCKQKSISIVEMVLSKERIKDKFGGNIIHWIKIISIALDARLITLLKKKAGPYAEYFKKIFQPKKTPQKSKLQQERSQSTLKNSNSRRTSPSSLPFVPDKQYQTQVNIIFDLIIRLIKYNPLYQMYLQDMKIARNTHTKTNKDYFVQKMLNLRKSSSFFKNSAQSQKNIEQTENYNKVIVMEQILLDSEKELLQYVNQVKENCYKVLSLAYQNIIEEQIQYQIKNLGYFVQGSIKLVNNLTLEEGFKKFPFADQSFRLSLLQNWYMTSNPLVLDQITNVMRYVYDQQQIYLRCLNSTMVIFTPQLASFYEQVQPAFVQAQRLTFCISVWYIPQILKSYPSYEQNYHTLLRALQIINGHIKKINIKNQYTLNEYQQILQNLGCLDIVAGLMKHLGKFEKKKKKNKVRQNQRKNQEYRTMDKEQLLIFGQLTKLVQFFVYLNSKNKCKLIIVLGQILTTSMSSFQILLFLLKQQTGLQTYISLLTKDILTNIITMLPFTKQFLQLVLVLSNYQFIVVIHQISNILSQLNQSQSFIIEDNKCFILFCKIGYRVIEMGGCCSFYMIWLHDRLLLAWLEREVGSNMHFSTKIIQTINTEIIQMYSSVAFLIYSLFFNRTFEKMQNKPRKITQTLSQHLQKNTYTGNILKNSQGIKLINNYISKQIFATVLQNDSTAMIIYIRYYIYDLLPLLAVFNDNNNSFLKNQQQKKNVLNKSKQYLKIYTQLNEINKQSLTSSKSQNQNKNKTKYRIVEEHKGIQLNIQKKLKQIQLFIKDSTSVQSFKPRSKYIQPAFRPQFASRQPRKLFLSPAKQKADQFEKMSNKAIKLWYKAKLSVNQNKQKFMNRDKWIDDLQKLQSQFQGSEKDKQRIINSNDLIAKSISIIVNGSMLQLNPQNQNFLLKNGINWVLKQVQTKAKKDRKMMKMDSPTNKLPKSQNKYLIKKFQTITVIISILQQIVLKLQSQQFKNIISICYMLKLIFLLFQLVPQQISLDTKEKIVIKIVEIMQRLLDYYKIHRFLLDQFENSKVLDKWQVINSWNPINLLAEFVQIFMRLNSNITTAQYQKISRIFIKAKIRLEKCQVKDPTLNLQPIFYQLSQKSQHDLKQAQQSLLYDEQLYRSLNFLNWVHIDKTI